MENPGALGPKTDLRQAAVARLSVKHGVQLRERLGGFSTFVTPHCSQPRAPFVGTEPTELDLRQTSAGTQESRMEFTEILVGRDQGEDAGALAEQTIGKAEEPRQALA